MIRFWLWLAVLAPLLAATPARAQGPQPALTQDQARSALETLNDPKKRAAFAATLEALLNAQPAPAATAPAEPAGPQPASTPVAEAITLAPNSLGAQVLLSMSAFLNRLTDHAVQATQTLQSFPLLWAWAAVMLTNPTGQRLLLETGWRLGSALAVAGAVYFALRFATRQPLARVLALGRPAPGAPDGSTDAADWAARGGIEPPAKRSGFGARLRLGLARLALGLAPALGLLIAGHLVAASRIGGQTDSRLIILAVIDAILVSHVLLAISTLLFMPEPRGLKLLPSRPALGAWLMRWSRRLILIGVPGYTIGEVGLLLGLSSQAHDAVQKLVGLVLWLCLAIMVLQRRRRVRTWLSSPPGASGARHRIRDRLAGYWHLPALFLLAAIFLNWTLGSEEASGRSIWYVLATAGILASALLARLAVTAFFARMGARPGDGRDHSMRARIGAYHPAFRWLVTVSIDILTLLGLLQLFGLGGLSWLLTTQVGHRLASGFTSIGVTIGLAFAVWEGVNIAIQMHLETLRRDAQAARSARLRTLLPLIRTALSIALTVIAGLMVLSEIGVNIGPLLAGAGIAGVAIGFGSQKLVQDVITGVFLLLENTVQVGDVVKVGDQSGIVESLSVRTIRLRTEDASVVVIPFSAVTTVVNMTRDFSRAVITVHIGLSADVDRAIAAMREIAAGMRAEEAWSGAILDDLEVMGLEKFTEASLLIKCRIMCTPFKRWPVGWEFNRRMKARFEQEGIEIPIRL